MTRRGDRVPRPAGPDEWDIYAADNNSGQGWDELCRSHPAAVSIDAPSLLPVATALAPA